MSGQGHPPAGWYRESDDPTQERLWDGDEWRRWVRPYLEGRSEPNPAGWRADPKREGYEHLWTGEMWSGLTRPSDGSAPPVLPAPVPVHTGMTFADPNPPVSVRNLGDWIRVLLVVTILTNLAALVYHQILITRLTELSNGEFVTTDQLETAINGSRAIDLGSGGLWLVTAILFVTWFYRAYRNLIRFGIADIRYGPGWAVGGWFIPIFNLFRPKAIANDIWKGSASAAADDVSRWRTANLSDLVNWWWGVWVAAIVIGPFGGRGLSTVGDIERATLSSVRDYRDSLWLGQGVWVLLIVAAVLGYLYVRGICRMQQQVVEGWDGTLPTGVKTCPECAEEVKAAARVCRFCGHRFEEPLAAGSVE